jgi:hypothetical protein
MKNLSMKRLILPVAFSLLATAGAAWGDVIPVVNGDFETLPSGGLPYGGVATGYFSDYVGIPGWTTSGDTGQWQPNPSYLSAPPNGPTVGYSDGPTISQIVAPTVVLGKTYTLTVDIGARTDVSTARYAELLINGTPYLATGTPANGSGLWYPFTATYVGKAADVGQSIEIRLGTPGVQGDFDNVQQIATPEPASPASTVHSALA